MSNLFFFFFFPPFFFFFLSSLPYFVSCPCPPSNVKSFNLFFVHASCFFFFVAYLLLSWIGLVIADVDPSPFSWPQMAANKGTIYILHHPPFFFLLRIVLLFLQGFDAYQVSLLFSSGPNNPFKMVLTSLPPFSLVLSLVEGCSMTKKENLIPPFFPFPLSSPCQTEIKAWNNS